MHGSQWGLSSAPRTAQATARGVGCTGDCTVCVGCRCVERASSLLEEKREMDERARAELLGIVRTGAHHTHHLMTC